MFYIFQVNLETSLSDAEKEARLAPQTPHETFLHLVLGWSRESADGFRRITGLFVCSCVNLTVFEALLALLRCLGNGLLHGRSTVKSSIPEASRRGLQLDASLLSIRCLALSNAGASEPDVNILQHDAKSV